MCASPRLTPGNSLALLPCGNLGKYPLCLLAPKISETTSRSHLADNLLIVILDNIASLSVAFTIGATGCDDESHVVLVRVWEMAEIYFNVIYKGFHSYRWEGCKRIQLIIQLT